LGGTGGGEADGGLGLVDLFLLRQRKKKKRPIEPAMRRAATAEPTPMPTATGVLTPLEEDGVGVGMRS
jgi:hypothetical protein